MKPFNWRITLQQPVRTQDGYGEQVLTWSTVATVWADRMGAKGRETYAAGHDLATVEETFKIKYDSAVAPVDGTWRVVFNGKNHNIAAAVDVGRKEFIVITCTTGANNG